MNKILYALGAIATAASILVSCDEWEPVFTGDYGKGKVYEPVTLVANKTILELKSMYNKTPLKIQDNIIIKGQVVSDDKSGNVYKSLYIQDETSGIEIKLGKSGLYNDYKLGQWVYVKCSGLTLGAYNGMLQIGYEDPTGDYETSYLDVQYIIDTHVFRGELGTPVEPKKISADDLLKEENLGCYVEIDGLTYGNEVFCLIYVDPNKDTKANTNRIFLSSTGQNYQPVDDPTWGITTWAMSKQGLLNYLEDGAFNKATLADYSKTLEDEELMNTLKKNAAAYAVSQYFKMGSTSVQVRSSGYAKFADTQMDERILDGAKVNFKGIATVYNGSSQFTLLDLDGVEIVEE